MNESTGAILEELATAFPWVSPDIDDEAWLKAFGEQFPWIKTRERDLVSAHQEWLELRVHLPLLTPKDLLYYMPFVLLDLTLTHTNDSIQTEYAEHVIMELGSCSDYSESHYRETVDFFGMEVAQQERVSNAAAIAYSEGSFSEFNEQQRLAVYHWLQSTGDWNDLEMFGEELDLALRCWKDPQSLPHDAPNARDP